MTFLNFPYQSKINHVNNAKEERKLLESIKNRIIVILENKSHN
jgi:hypothetical protein